jgi:hypothetical protein
MGQVWDVRGFDHLIEPQYLQIFQLLTQMRLEWVVGLSDK